MTSSIKFEEQLNFDEHCCSFFSQILYAKLEFGATTLHVGLSISKSKAIENTQYKLKF